MRPTPQTGSHIPVFTRRRAQAGVPSAAISPGRYQTTRKREMRKTFRQSAGINPPHQPRIRRKEQHRIGVPPNPQISRLLLTVHAVVHQQHGAPLSTFWVFYRNNDPRTASSGAKPPSRSLVDGSAPSFTVLALRSRAVVQVQQRGKGQTRLFCST